MIGYWRDNVVCLSVVSLQRGALWLNDTSVKVGLYEDLLCLMRIVVQ